jgi:hypothetical protein
MEPPLSGRNSIKANGRNDPSEPASGQRASVWGWVHRLRALRLQWRRTARRNRTCKDRRWRRAGTEMVRRGRHAARRRPCLQKKAARWGGGGGDGAPDRSGRRSALRTRIGGKKKRRTRQGQGTPLWGPPFTAGLDHSGVKTARRTPHGLAVSGLSAVQG